MKDEARMRETDADREVRDRALAVTADELRQFVERIEKLEEEKRDLSDDQKVVMAEAKARGYDLWAIREVVKLRRVKRDVLAEKEAVLDLYRGALGI